MKQFMLCCLLTTALSISAIAQVQFYTSCNYRGYTANLGAGNYYNSAQFSLPDRSISAVKVPLGYRVELYTSINMAGVPVVLTASRSCLPGGIGDAVRSIRITYADNTPEETFNPYGGVMVFTECNFGGRNAYLPPGDYPTLRSVIGNNAISSLHIPEGMVIELFQEINFRGTSTGRITTDNRCLGDYWNNTASSARIYYNTGGWIPPTAPPHIANNGSITIYTGCNYIGKANNFEQGNFANLRASLNNQPAGSIMIPAGLTVEFYSQPNYGGYLMGKYTANKPCIQSNIQYRAASMRVYASGGNTGGSANAGVIVYTGCNFAGNKRILGPGNYNNITTSGYISPSSFRVPPGYQIELFSETNLRGTSTGKMSSNIDCLGNWIRGKARSARVTRQSIEPTPRQNQ
ncbi:hypothetical protein ACFSQD_00830 [Flavihumibacter stibioxidans]|uniref:Beta/gamma crystallin 'Greek key' domain-containing protein n=1 Tax=Flavihumibacter stibioxidans TaxID=1834163 RepID=A0ABR7ME52_9BACT|nr:hypothetical protein [Flavihumibacter stibioxidans]MBC6493045.1 hypothetical protein [Flavihumibacter stibioxidans]